MKIFVVSDGLPGYLLYPIVLSGLPIVGSPLQASDKSCLKNNRKCMKILSFEKISSIPINLIQLHYFADVINEFKLIDWEVRWMNCDFSDLKQETIIRE